MAGTPKIIEGTYQVVGDGPEPLLTPQWRGSPGVVLVLILLVLRIAAAIAY